MVFSRSCFSRATYPLTIVLLGCLVACLIVDSYAHYLHQVAHVIFKIRLVYLTFELLAGNSGKY